MLNKLNKQIDINIFTNNEDLKLYVIFLLLAIFLKIKKIPPKNINKSENNN